MDMTGAGPAPPQVRDAPRGRIDWIDAARGLAIILVVIGHVERGLMNAAMIPSSVGWRLLDGVIYAFHMPAFFLLAGIHAQRALNRSAGAFLTDKLKTIVWPYILWSLLHGCTTWALADRVNTPTHPADLLSLAWAPIAQYWFLYALLLCHLLSLALWPHRRLLVTAAIGLAIVTAFLGAGEIALMAMQQFPFFLVGLLAGPWLIGHADGLRRSARAIAFGGFVLLLITCQITWQWQPGGPITAAFFYLAALSGIAGLLALALILNEGPRWLNRLGQASMAIFVAHTFFAAGLRIGINMAGISPPIAATFIASVAIGLVGPWLMYEFFGRLGLNTPLGLGKYVRR